ncbi:MAG: Kynurenine formamidase [Acidobacteria bacterium]|nr:Kynurenine formamidase [Acidobacteriota bacterium]
MKIYDITVPISNALPVYPGDPAIHIERIQSLEKGDIARVSHLSFSTHIGTHIDPPYHFIKDGVPLDQAPLDIFIGPARVVDVGAAASIDAALLATFDLEGASRVIFKTRNSRLWRETSEFQKDFVYLETDAAEALVARGVKLVGIDYLSIEKFGFDKPTTHWTLLGNNVFIVEGLDLNEIAPGDYELICLPLKIKDGDGGPARVVLRELN